MQFPLQPDPRSLSGRNAHLEAPQPHVVIAEDDDDFRVLLTSALRQDGYRVTAVTAGVPLLQALWDADSQELPSLVISDERMPGIRGLQAFRHVRDRGMTLPLVLITAFGDDALIARATDIGVVVIRKPFAIEDLRIVARFLTASNHGTLGTPPRRVERAIVSS